MADDTIIELAAYESVKLTGRNVIVRFELDSATLQALIAQGTTDIRLSTIEDEHDFSFGNKPTVRMQHVLGCIQ
jgi:hypothetical protein